MVVVAEGVAGTDAPVAAMDEKLGFLVPRDLTRAIDRLALCSEHGGGFRRSRAAHAPLVAVRNHMLTGLGHRPSSGFSSRYSGASSPPKGPRTDLSSREYPSISAIRSAMLY